MPKYILSMPHLVVGYFLPRPFIGSAMFNKEVESVYEDLK